MSACKRKQALANLERALSRLEEALAVPEDAPLAIDGTIRDRAYLEESQARSGG
jgi:hypothetical protein